MFWGLIMEPERRYTQQVTKSFHISMASLDIASSGEDAAQVMCGYEGRNYLLCTLKKPETLQCNLDLEFSAGSQVSFASNGKAHIHLTGYLTDVDEDGLTLTDLEEQEEEDVEEEEQVEEKPGKKKKLKKENEQVEPPTKKAKLFNGSVNEEDVEDESDDSDFEESSEDEAENEDSGEEEASDEEAEEEEQDDSEDEEDKEEEIPPKLNKKQKKLLKQQQQQQQQVNGEAKKPIKKEQQQQQKKQKRILDKGVIVEDLVEGNGPPAKNGRFVTVYYEGRLEKNNKMFDSSTKGPGFKLRLGSGEVIKAWDIGIVGMKVGGKRKITCPPHTAYGPKGSPPAIPPNATLVFTVELKKIN